MCFCYMMGEYIRANSVIVSLMGSFSLCKTHFGRRPMVVNALFLWCRNVGLWRYKIYAHNPTPNDWMLVKTFLYEGPSRRPFFLCSGKIGISDRRLVLFRMFD